MRFRTTEIACLLGALAALLPLGASAQSGKLQLSATLGIGGRFRPGSWTPITVSVVNPGPETVQGQVQALAVDQTGADNGSVVFSQAAEIPPGTAPQFFQIDTRGLQADYGNIGVRVVNGETRGDGGTLAQISSVADAKRNLFNGVPVSPRDLLLVGFSADSTAITRLNGQRWGLMHTANGLAPDAPPVQQYYANGGTMQPARNTVNAAMVEAAAALPPEMPDRLAGYDGVDAVVLRGDAPLDSLTETQTDALKAWVSAGGRLIVCGGVDPTPYGNSFYTGLLPADVSAPDGNAIAGLTLTPKPLTGVQVMARQGAQPQIVNGPYGAGCVTLLAFDPASATSGAEAAQWKQILSAAPSSMLGVVAAHESGNNGTFYGDNGQLSDAVLRAPALDAPGAGVVALFLIGYVLILVPLNYLVLKRLDKKEWSWATIPVLVVLFAAATYGVGYASKGSSIFVNRAAILETTAGQSQAGVYADIGIFSPSRSSYDITLSDPNALSAIPQDPDEVYNSYRRGPDSGAAGVTRFVESGEQEKLQDIAVNMWAMRAFDVQTVTNLGGTFSSTLALSGNANFVSGTITNRTGHSLTHCNLYVSGQWKALSDLPAGASQPVTAAYFPASQTSAGQVWPALPSPIDPAMQDAGGGSVRDRMTASLTSFVNSIGGANNGGQYYYGNGMNNAPPAIFQPRPNEAILTGWCDDACLAGPLVLVDGHPVTENATTLVVIHIPLH